jgi:phosphinothricin acetyltransferase
MSTRTPVEVTVRPATREDVPRITEIYNHYIENTPVSFDLEPFSVGERLEWFSHYGTTGRYRAFVAERDGVVVGYTTSSPFRVKQAYETTVEMTIVCAPDAVGMRIGSRLYESILPLLETEDVHMACARITLPNEASCAIHKRFGFELIGVEPEVGRKFGRFWDVAWYMRRVG